MNITDICNMALAFIAKGKISSIEEQSESARQCKLFYDTTRKDLLRCYTWGFAKRVSKLAELNVKSPYWNFVYAYPQKCIAVRKIFDVDTGAAIRAGEQAQEEWDLYMASDNVLGIGCNIPAAWLEYTYDVDDVEMFSSDFLQAFAHMLAFNLAPQLTGNSGLQQTQYQLAQAYLQKAKYSTASEKKEIPDYPCKYFNGRA